MRRSTADQIALLLTITVVVVVIGTALVILFITLTRPAEDVSETADAIGRILAVLVGVVAGYIAGRRINGNGHG